MTGHLATPARLEHLGWARRRLALVAAGTGLVATATYLSPVPEPVSSAAFGLIGLGTAVALVVGPRLHRPTRPWPWHLLTAAVVLFLTGVLLRPVASGPDAAWPFLPDLFSLPGYVLAVLALRGFVRARHATDRHAFTDALAVVSSATLVSLVYFVLPAVAVPGRPPWAAVVAGVYPLFDVVLVLALLQLAFTTAVREPALLLLGAAIGGVLAGDVGYAVIGRTGELVGPRWMDVPFGLAFTALAAAVLHPSMRALTEPRPRPVQAWSRSRLALLLAATAVPPVIWVLDPPQTTGARVVSAFAALAAATALVVRGSAAVDGYASTQRVLRHRATHDALTGLANRTLLTETLSTALAASRRCPGRVRLLFLDLDGFKYVNDSWGHEVGDELLVAVAGRLTAAVGPRDLVCRIGGDEFVIATTVVAGSPDGHGPGDHGPGSPGPEDPGPDDGVLTARVLAAFREPFALSCTDAVVSASVGVAGDDGRSTPESLVRDADIAMYRAKGEGRDRAVHFDHSMRQEVRARVETELALRHALDADQLSLHYQPVVDMRSGRLTGFEALARWHHAVLGPVPPERFVALAEETGLIHQLGAWVIETATRQLRAWQDAGAPAHLSLSLNVSTRQLADVRMLATLRRALDASRVRPDRLCLEITESAMLGSNETTERTLAAIRRLGVGLAVDDFGTGYSAVGYLRRLPATQLKIDRTFVTDLEHDPADREIVRAVTAMAQALGVSVVAEGVETTAQRDVLASLGVDRGQGWLFGRPVPAAEAMRMVAGALPVRQAGAGNSYAQ